MILDPNDIPVTANKFLNTGMQPLTSCSEYCGYKNYIWNSKNEAIENLLKKVKNLISQLCYSKIEEKCHQ